MRESNLLQHIYAATTELPPSVTIPPGDDMGEILIGAERVLVTVDQVADGVHVDLHTASLEQVARKAITRNLSDVAAMGATPAAAVAAACLPRDFGQLRAEQLFDAMRRVAIDFACPLIGGDISMWDGRLILTVTIFATAANPILRRGAKPGDVIIVSGTLGASLETFDNHTHHLDFEPRLSLGRALANHPSLRPHCMIDLSDGLATDLAHLCAASNVCAEIDLAKLPVSPAARQASKHTSRPPWDRALRDGEDYELCFTLSPEQARSLGAHIAGVQLTPIGRIIQPPAVSQPTITLLMPDGNRQPLTQTGWEHRGSDPNT